MRLKDIREDYDIKQSTIASYLNIKQNTYSQYECEKRQIPIDMLIKLAILFNVSIDYILELTDISQIYPIGVKYKIYAKSLKNKLYNNN